MAVTSLKRTRRRHKDSRIKRDLDADLLWERPADWPQLPEILPTEHKVAGLWKVEDHDSNYIAVVMGMGSGTYHVDWGDGTSSNVASGGQATHQYTYSDAALGPVTSEGFKVAVVTVQPNGGIAATTFSINTKHFSLGSNNNWSSNWLDIRMSLPSISTAANFSIGNSSAIVHRNLRQFEYVGDCALNNGSNLFVGAISLESLKLPKTFTANMTNMTGMFTGLTKLKYIPDLDTHACTNHASLFSGCTQLRRIPALDYSVTNSLTATFQNCVSLEYIPDLGSIGNCSSTQTMFQGCSSLRTAPSLISNSSLASAINMFLNCSSLRSIPVFNTSGLTNPQSMFSGCNSLAIIPAFDFSACLTGNATTMFTGCYSMSKNLSFGLKFTHTLPGQMSGAALDVYYTNLGTASAQTITVSGNQVASDTPTIATAKGWTVTGS